MTVRISHKKPQLCVTSIHHLDQHDVVVKRPVSVLVVPDDQGDVEPLLEALHLHNAVFPKDHLHHVTPAEIEVEKKQMSEIFVIFVMFDYLV